MEEDPRLVRRAMRVYGRDAGRRPCRPRPRNPDEPHPTAVFTSTATCSLQRGMQTGERRASTTGTSSRIRNGSSGSSRLSGSPDTGSGYRSSATCSDTAKLSTGRLTRFAASTGSTSTVSCRKTWKTGREATRSLRIRPRYCAGVRARCRSHSTRRHRRRSGTRCSLHDGRGLSRFTGMAGGLCSLGRLATFRCRPTSSGTFEVVPGIGRTPGSDSASSPCSFPSQDRDDAVRLGPPCHVTEPSCIPRHASRRSRSRLDRADRHPGLQCH